MGRTVGTRKTSRNRTKTTVGRQYNERTTVPRAAEVGGALNSRTRSRVLTLVGGSGARRAMMEAVVGVAVAKGVWTRCWEGERLSRPLGAVLCRPRW